MSWILILVLFFNIPSCHGRFRKGKNTVEQSEIKFDENVLSYQEGSVSCEPGAPRRPTPGIDLLQNSFLPLKPNDNTGSKIFDFIRRTSKSCMRWDYDGITTLSTKQGNRNVEAFHSKTLFSLMTENKLNIQAKAGTRLGAFSAKVSGTYHQSLEVADKQEFNRSWEALRVSQIDNSFVIMNERQRFPTLDEDFVQIIKDKCNSSEDRSQNEHVFSVCLRNLLRTRSHFAASASLGSQTVKLTTASSEYMDKNRAESTEVSASASASYLFTSGSGGGGGGQKNHSHEDEEKAHRSVSVNYIGEPPDANTLIIPTAEFPGIIEKTLRIICDLIPQSIVRHHCTKFISSKAFCFSQFPDAPIYYENYAKMTEHLFQIKTYEDCQDLGFPLLGMKLNFSLVDPTFETNTLINASSFKDCLMDCSNQTDCALASFNNGSCQMCKSKTSGHTKFSVYKIDKASSYTSEKLCTDYLTNIALGIKATVTTERYKMNGEVRVEGEENDTAKFCTLEFPEFQSVFHCFESLQQCKERESCYSQAFHLPLQPIFPPELLDSYHDKPPSLFGPPLFNTDEILGDVLARTVFDHEELTNITEIAKLCAYVLSHRTLVPLPGSTSEMVDSLSLNFAHKCRTKCGETEGCNTIAARIKVNKTECDRPFAGVLTDNEMLTLKESMVNKYLFDQKLDKDSLNNKSLEVDPDAMLGKVSGKCHDNKPKGMPLPYSASCDFYNEGQITVISGAKPICMLIPGLCDMKVGQIIRMKTFRRLLDFDIHSNKSSNKDV